MLSHKCELYRHTFQKLRGLPQTPYLRNGLTLFDSSLSVRAEMPSNESPWGEGGYILRMSETVRTCPICSDFALHLFSFDFYHVQATNGFCNVLRFPAVSIFAKICGFLGNLGNLCLPNAVISRRTENLQESAKKP